MIRERHINTDPILEEFSEKPFVGSSLGGHVRSFQVGTWSGNGEGTSKKYLETTTCTQSDEEEYAVRRYLKKHKHYIGDELRVTEPNHGYTVGEVINKSGVCVTGMNDEGEKLVYKLAETLQNLGFIWEK